MRAVDVRSFRRLEPIYGMGVILRVFFFFNFNRCFLLWFFFRADVGGFVGAFLCFDFLFC